MYLGLFVGRFSSALAIWYWRHEWGDWLWIGLWVLRYTIEVARKMDGHFGIRLRLPGIYADNLTQFKDGRGEWARRRMVAFRNKAFRGSRPDGA